MSDYFFSVSSRLLYSSRVFSCGLRLLTCSASNPDNFSKSLHLSFNRRLSALDYPLQSAACCPVEESFFRCSVIRVVRCRHVYSTKVELHSQLFVS